MNDKKIIYKNTTNIDPILELYRGKIYCQIINMFINIVTDNLGTVIFSVKKSCPRTLINLLSSWMFTLYAFETNIDSFFPNFFNNIEPLRITLLDFCKHDDNINKNYTEIVNNILNEFLGYIKIQMEILDKYKLSQFYLNSKNNFQISKKSIIQIRETEEIQFYKFKINIFFGIKDKRLVNILDNILLPIDIYNKLVSNYTGNTNIDVILWIIIFRYQLLGSNNHQLGILPNIINSMKNDYNLEFECFASCINASLPNYCSIYYDLEQYFGSKGNFFNMNFVEGVYSFNPPYQKNIMEKGIQRAFTLLENASTLGKKLTFIMTIPIWDKEGQEMLNENTKIDYGDFEIIKDIKASKYFTNIRLISKDNFTYLDHNFKLYKNKTIQNTYIIMLSTDKNIDFSKINEYNFMI
jgi:hypothetical protein